MQSETNQAKSKRDLIWEQKKRLREQKFQLGSQENIPSSENIGFSNKNVKSEENQFEERKDNIYNQYQNRNGIKNDYITYEKREIKELYPQNYDYYEKNPVSIPSHQIKNENHEAIVQNRYEIKDYNENKKEFSNNEDNKAKIIKKEYGDFLKQQIKEKDNQNKKVSNSFNENNNEIQNYDDKNARIIKREYGDFLKQQIKEKENKKINESLSHDDKKEKLQSLMSNQTYDPFGRPGGGGPNRRFLSKDPHPKSNNVQTRPFSEQESINRVYEDKNNDYSDRYLKNLEQENFRKQNYEAFLQSANKNKKPQISPQNNRIDSNINNYENINQNQYKPKTGRNLLMYENMTQNEIIKKEVKSQEIQKVLMEQIEQKKRLKELEKQKQKEEEIIEEMRLKKEREELERNLKNEEEKKKNKLEKVNQDNYALKNDQKKNRNDFEKNENQQEKNSDVIARNLILKTDVSKEFLEQEGKNSRNNARNRKEGSQENMIMIRENDNFNQNNNQYYRQNNNQQNINNNDYHSKIQQEIESIRNEMLNNRMNMQNQLNEIKNEASKAIEMKNKAEQELLQLREELKQKMLEEKKYQSDLLSALQKNQPKNPKNQLNIFPKLSSENQISYQKSPPISFQNNYNLKGPLKIYEKGGITANSDVFKQFSENNYNSNNNGDQTLVCETKMVPIEAIDQFIKNNQNNVLTFSKIEKLATRPNSTKDIEFPNENTNFEFDPKRTNKNFIIKKRPSSQKYRRDEKNTDNSINDDITKEIDFLLNKNNNENRKGSALLNQAGRGILDLNKYNENIKKTNENFNSSNFDDKFKNKQKNQTYSNETLNSDFHEKEFGIKLGSGFPTLRDDDNMDELDKMIRKESRDHTMDYNTINIEEINKKNDERLIKFDGFSKGNDVLLKNNYNSNGLRMIEEEGSKEKLNKYNYLFDK